MLHIDLSQPNYITRYTGIGGRLWTRFGWLIPIPVDDLIGRDLQLVLDDTWSNKGTVTFPDADSSLGDAHNAFRGHTIGATPFAFSDGRWSLGVTGIVTTGAPVTVDPWMPGVPRAITFSVIDDAGLGYPPLPPYNTESLELTIKGTYTTTTGFTMPFLEEVVEPLEPPSETHPPTGGDYSNTTGGDIQAVIRGGTPEQPLRGGTPQVSIRAGTYDETATGGEVL